MANIIIKRPRLMQMVRTRDGKTVGRVVKRSSETWKKYDGYVKSLQGLYVPKDIAKHL